MKLPRLSIVKDAWKYNRLFKRIVYYFFAILLIASIVVSIYVSQAPKEFDVTEITAQYITKNNLKNTAGMTSAVTLHHTVEVLLNKPGGFIRNDVMPPFVFLDNISNWEYGVIRQIREFARAFKNDFSRSQSQSNEDFELTRAEPLYNTTDDSWAFPPTETRYREGNQHLANYIVRLSEGKDTSFHARADNLNNWLASVSTHLGSLSQRLSASIATKRVDLDQDQDGKYIYTKTPWLQLDDVFYETRGHAWALIHYLKAAEIDFEDLLKKKNAVKPLKQVIKELEASQAQLWSPMILNGSGYGILANHSLTLANYISRANAGIIELRNLLKQG